ncbi:MAG: homoserine O-succinyltransferase [Acidimicrobiaceae bacterium]|nr:homoserine O-succinyltransferase [Acidimicrobiaceae bacterium]
MDSDGPLTCAFVNDMPDGAFLHTERQFVDLLGAGSGSIAIELRSYTLPGVLRGREIAEHVARLCFPLEDLWASSPDIVIVTGSEPLTATLAAEAYWGDLVHLLEWSTATSSSVVLSCLAAHAALLQFDGIDRTRLAAKLTGVFDQQVRAKHYLTTDLPSSIVLPHSRLNDVPRALVEGVGYEVLIGSEECGWSVAHRLRGHCELVLIQGHPEYEASSLLREYRRDTERYLRGERRDQPALPVGCVASADEDMIASFHGRVVSGELDPLLMGALPFHELAARVGWPWRTAATKLYGNWITEAFQKSRERHGR